MSIANSISTDSFISEVERNRPIWDSSCEAYTVKRDKEAAWNTLFSNLFVGFDEKPDHEKAAITDAMQRRWKNIRTCFTRELLKRKMDFVIESKGKRRKRYLYYEQLRFLEPFTKNISNYSSKDVDDQEEGECPVSSPTKQDRTLHRAQLVHSEGLPTKLNTQKLEVIEQRVPNEPVSCPSEDEHDRLFLLSLVSELKRVPIEKKIKVKTDILMAISNCQQF